jgi:hypothetical protein
VDLSQGRYTQVIKGTIVEKSTQLPLTGASVLLLNSEPLLGTVTDGKGEFRLEKVPVERQSIRVTYIGFKELVLVNLNVATGKELPEF